MFPAHRLASCPGIVLVALSAASAWAQAPAVAELRTQSVAGVTYFHVRFESPKDLQLPPRDDPFRWWLPSRPALTRFPQLVPQDGKTAAVCPRVNWDDRFGPGKDKAPIEGRPFVEGLEFFGKVTDAKEPATLLLLYPTEPKTAPGKGKDEPVLQELLRQQGSWAEVAVTLDFAKAKKVKAPGKARDPQDWP